MSTPATPPSNSAKPAASTAAPAQAQVTPPGKETPIPAAPSAGASQPPRLLKVKVDGKEMELPENEVLELASAGRASNQRFQEAARMRREAEQVLQFAKENPAEFFQKTGMNARQWAEQYLINELKKEAESPEQKKARENEEKLRKYEDDEKKRTDETKRKELEQVTNMERERLDKVFTQALFDSGLPRTKFTVKRMAELQLINIKNKYELQPAQLAKLVREDYANEQKALLSSLEGDQLLDFLGPDLIKKFSKAQIAKLKARASSGQVVQKTPQKDAGAPQMSWREYQKKNRRIG